MYRINIGIGHVQLFFRHLSTRGSFWTTAASAYVACAERRWILHWLAWRKGSCSDEGMSNAIISKTYCIWSLKPPIKCIVRVYQYISLHCCVHIPQYGPDCYLNALNHITIVSVSLVLDLTLAHWAPVFPMAPAVDWAQHIFPIRSDGLWAV
jgi:hypothetical protein